jgi:DNA polymerase-3 subunit gamma/tau
MGKPLELHRKYRPEYFKEVIGQDAAVKSIEKAVDRNDVHAYLLGGPSGCGKTTIARIIAAELGCTERGLMEVDAATNSGADAMRAIQEPLQYRPFGKSDARAIIIDECHALSKQAWQVLLKGLEEPAAHVYWFLCTTELSKVPATIKTRCASYTLKEVADPLLAKHCDMVCKAESIKLGPGVHDVLIKSAGGSPRQLLVNLAVVRDAADKREAADLLKAVLDSDATLELCRLLQSGGSWMKAMAIFEKLKDENLEGVRIIVSNYFAKVASGASSDKAAGRALMILSNFSASYNQSDKAAPLLLSIGQCLLGE